MAGGEDQSRRLGRAVSTLTLKGVAGFDFEFKTKADEEELQREFLRWMQRGCRQLGLQLSYRKQYSGFQVAINGALPEMQALPVYCYSELAAIANAASKPPNVERRRRILMRILDSFEKGLDQITESVNTIMLAEEAEGAKIIPRSIDFDPGSKTHLKATLDAFRLALVQAMIGRITVRALLEECHTVIEHLMNALLSRAEQQALSYEGKIDAMIEAGVFEIPGFKWEFVAGEFPPRLKELKGRRRDSKHRGQAVDHDHAMDLVDAAEASVHLLLGEIRRRDREAGTAPSESLEVTEARRKIRERDAERRAA
jgi:hypothetical protein